MSGGMAVIIGLNYEAERSHGGSAVMLLNAAQRKSSRSGGGGLQSARARLGVQSGGRVRCHCLVPTARVAAPGPTKAGYGACWQCPVPTRGWFCTPRSGCGIRCVCADHRPGKRQHERPTTCRILSLPQSPPLPSAQSIVTQLWPPPRTCSAEPTC